MDDIKSSKNIYYIDGLVQDCSISGVLEMEILQPSTTHRYIKQYDTSK